eukprot:PhF_6_TR10215/c0_g1_i1/m.15835
MGATCGVCLGSDQVAEGTNKHERKHEDLASSNSHGLQLTSPPSGNKLSGGGPHPPSNTSAEAPTRHGIRKRNSARDLSLHREFDMQGDGAPLTAPSDVEIKRQSREDATSASAAGTTSDVKAFSLSQTPNQQQLLQVSQLRGNRQTSISFVPSIENSMAALGNGGADEPSALSRSRAPSQANVDYLPPGVPIERIEVTTEADSTERGKPRRIGSHMSSHTAKVTSKSSNRSLLYQQPSGPIDEDGDIDTSASSQTHTDNSASTNDNQPAPMMLLGSRTSIARQLLGGAESHMRSSRSGVAASSTSHKQQQGVSLNNNLSTSNSESAASPPQSLGGGRRPRKRPSIMMAPNGNATVGGNSHSPNQ